MKDILWVIAPAFIGLAAPAHAEVKPVNALSFHSAHIESVTASPDTIWSRLAAPKTWWNPEHSWSGATDGFYLDAKAGGCFCELIQEKGPDGKLKAKGSVEHMRVIFADPGKVLRMQGALGPLQSEAVLGVLTVAIEALPDGKGSRISFNYVVGGHSRFIPDKIAKAVDAVIAEQFGRLLQPFDRVVAGAAPTLLPFVLEPEKGSPKAGGVKLDLADIDQRAAEENKPTENDPVDNDDAVPETAQPRA